MKLFTLPDLGEGLPDAEVVRWLVNEGDSVTLDQPMVEVETAKAVVEVPSPYTGKISRLFAQPGDVIEVGAPLVEFELEQDSGQNNVKHSETDSQNTHQPTDASSSTQEPSSQQATSGLKTFMLPDLGEGLPDAEIVRWLVEEKEKVTLDQPMVEVETAKAVVEVPAPQSGQIAKLFGQAGDVIAVGSPLMAFVDNTASTTSTTSSENTTTNTASSSPDAATVVGAVEVGNQVKTESANAVIQALARKLKVDWKQVAGTGPQGQLTQADIKTAAKNGSAPLSNHKKTASHITSTTVTSSASSATKSPLGFKASPAVRALAGRLGVDLSHCQASGYKGSITRHDVEHANKHPRQSQQTETSSTPQVVVDIPESMKPFIDETKVRGARGAMALGMAQSHAQVAATTLVEDVNISAWPPGTDALARYIRALVFACQSEPALNAWFDAGKMARYLHQQVHIGIAIDTPAGLYVPVVKQAETLSLTESRAAVQSLREKVAEKTIKPADMSHATITLSNFGSIAGRYGTPMVSPPQVAILGTGRFRKELQIIDGDIKEQKLLPLSLTFDHRACTGGEAARFLAALMQDLALPE